MWGQPPRPSSERSEPATMHVWGRALENLPRAKPRGSLAAPMLSATLCLCKRRPGRKEKLSPAPTPENRPEPLTNSARPAAQPHNLCRYTKIAGPSQKSRSKPHPPWHEKSAAPRSVVRTPRNHTVDRNGSTSRTPSRSHSRSSSWRRKIAPPTSETAPANQPRTGNTSDVRAPSWEQRHPGCWPIAAAVSVC